MSDDESQMDNCANCGVDLPGRQSARDSCPNCGATARIVNLGVMRFSATSSVEVTPEVVRAVVGIPSAEAVGTPTVVQEHPSIDYESDVCLSQIEKLTKASFIGVCENDSHQPFAVAGTTKEEVIGGLSDHLRDEH